MTTLYRLLADFVVVVHFAFVAFVVLGQLLILVGGICRHNWVRNRWFRIVHLGAICLVVFESVCGITCPLTVWEQHLRDLAGDASYRGDFIATWVHDVLFFEAERWVFTIVYCVFGTIVLVSWFAIPPKSRSAFPG